MSFYYSPKVQRLVRDTHGSEFWGMCVRYNSAMLELLYENPEDYNHCTVDCSGFFFEQYARISGHIKNKPQFKRLVVSKKDLVIHNSRTLHSITLNSDIPRPSTELNDLQAFRYITRKLKTTTAKSFTYCFKNLEEQFPITNETYKLLNFKEAIKEANKDGYIEEYIKPCCLTTCIFIILDKEYCEVYMQQIPSIEISTTLIVPYQGKPTHDLLAELANKND